MFYINKKLFTLAVAAMLLLVATDLNAQAPQAPRKELSRLSSSKTLNDAATNEIVGSARSQLLQKISQTTSKVKSLSSKFTQTKQSAMLQQPLVMQGMMHYTAPNQLRWEYTSPEPMAFILHGDTIWLEKQGVKSLANNRMMKGITSMVMGCVTGRQLFSENDFTTQLFDDGKLYRAEMTPLRKDLKRMFARMTILFDKASLSVVEVRLYEKQGDCSIIQFQPTKVK